MENSPKNEFSFEELVRNSLDGNNRIIEAAVETAIQGGRYGVKITWNEDDTMMVKVDPTVPYGEIHEYRTY
jgi:hypothetical protein